MANPHYEPSPRKHLPVPHPPSPFPWMEPMSGYLVPDRFHVTAYNGDHQASAILRWEGENHDCTMTAVGP
ncbi:hypothetical protein QF027_006945 [Streptomyces canus]|nr:hypothetical protein [Streptomyces canus]